MATKTKVLNYATVDFDDPEELAEFRRQEVHKAGVRVKRAVKELQEKGILDKQGRRLRKELPPDMREGSKCGL